jgi:hypothetical protein
MNVPAELIIVENAGHAPIDSGTTTTPTLDEIYQRIEDFLSAYLV